MQASVEHSYDDHVFTSESEAKLSEDLKSSLRLNEESCSPNAISEQLQHHHDENDDVYVDANEHEHEDEDEDEEEFSFVFEGSNTSPIAAEDAFMNGQIKASFPHFNVDDEEKLPIKPQVKKVFVTSASSEIDEISGPYCEWSKKAALEASSSEACKKSNSTGFSKLWRFKEFRNRSNSDGRDAFVYLNNQSNTTSSSSSSGDREVKVNDGKTKVKKGGKTKTSTLSPHEIYLINKAKEDDRRRSYLPYRQEVVGFFTNVNGGMSKNVHPF